MRLSSIGILITSILLGFTHSSEPQHSLTQPSTNDLSEWNSNISIQLFAELEELARIVDISYCVGTSGIYRPFECVSRCHDFPDFELVDTFNTGPLLSDSCGYIVLDHGKNRIIVAFRGTYSIANTIADLSTIPQEYVPYPGQDRPDDSPKQKPFKCSDCTVHMGFWTSWQNTRPYVIRRLEYLREEYPEYQLNLVGHSLGGAIAALAGTEFNVAGWEPILTTFGEPRLGNEGLRDFLDASFGLRGGNHSRYRRITHKGDPVPLLPLQSWGYRPHAGEIYISKSSLRPSVPDVHHCIGDEDPNCIAGGAGGSYWFALGAQQALARFQKRWRTPTPVKHQTWQLFFAHRDYFWRLGLCVPGGDPVDWGRHRYDIGEDKNGKDDL